MGGEPNQAYWRGIRPTDPAENIPVDIKVCSVTLPVGIASVIGKLPVDVKAHTVNTPVDVKSHAVNTPVDVKSIDVDTPVKDSWLLQGTIACALADPLDAAIVLDTGQLTVGYYDFIVTMGANVNHNYWKLQHRNGANNSEIGASRFVLGAFSQHTLYIKNRYLAANERLRVEQRFDLTGRLYGAIWWTKRA